MTNRAEMLGRVARFDELRRDSGSYLDDDLPGHVRTAMMLIGTSRGRNDPSLASPLPPEDFTMGLQHAMTGNGPGLHSHRTVEVFMALSGTWRLYWIDDDGESETELRTWDVASVPAGRLARARADQRRRRPAARRSRRRRRRRTRVAPQRLGGGSSARPQPR